MLLAIDTATKWTGLALYDGVQIVNETGWISKSAQTIELAPELSRLLQQARLEAANIKAIAVAIGPGSYTALRIGLGMAKGFSLAYQIPLIGVSTLDINAAAFGPMEGDLIAIAEAGRTRVCFGRYRWRGRSGWKAIDPPEIATWEELIELLDPPLTVVGEITPDARKLLRASAKKPQLFPPAISVRRAGYLAEIGWRRYKKGHLDSASSLAPSYIRDPA